MGKFSIPPMFDYDIPPFEDNPDAWFHAIEDHFARNDLSWALITQFNLAFINVPKSISNMWPNFWIFNQFDRPFEAFKHAVLQLLAKNPAILHPATDSVSANLHPDTVAVPAVLHQDTVSAPANLHLSLIHI